MERATSCDEEARNFGVGSYEPVLSRGYSVPEFEISNIVLTMRINAIGF